jgi:hypothetical protein
MAQEIPVPGGIFLLTGFGSMIQEIEEHRGAIEGLCRPFRVRRLELVGSAAAGRFNPHSSDLDFLVDFEELRTNEYADTYLGLLEALEKLFRRQVDLVVAKSVKNPYLSESIQRPKTLLYAA